MRSSAGAQVVEEVGLLAPSPWRRILARRGAVVSLCILGTLWGGGLLAPVLEAVLGVQHDVVMLPQRYGEPSFPHLLGTDELGRDVLARLLYGGRISLLVAVLAALSSGAIGLCVGVVAGYFGGWVDSALMRITDAMLSVPLLPLVLLIAALAPGSPEGEPSWVRHVVASMAISSGAGLAWWHRRRAGLASASTGLYLLCFVLVLGGSAVVLLSTTDHSFRAVLHMLGLIVVFGWMTVARLARGAAMQVRNQDFVLAARALGAGHTWILRRHILPNVFGPVLVAVTLDVGSNILLEAALSFLGLGVQPPVPSWGNMLGVSLDALKKAPWLVFWPGAFIFLTVASMNVLGDHLRQVLDPAAMNPRR
ncbi:MAG: ABC transporter permease [Myxococcota bacterium]